MTKTDTFANIIAEYYNEIKRKFISGLKDKGYKFDEDILSDTFISCNTALKEKLLTKEEAVKYFWTSYINKIKSQPARNIIYMDEITPINEEDEYIEYDEFGAVSEYNMDIDNIYNYILDKVEEKFGIDIVNVWTKHVCDNKKISELREEYNDVNVEYQIKKVRKYVDKLIKTDKILMEMIKNFR